MTQRILVVDDDRQIVRLVQSYLEQAGYVVLTAADGATALRTIRAERPDLVVLDLMLPDTDGWAITRTVRSDTSLTGLPIVMLTARVEDTDKIVGLELGADDYIAKPFNPRELLARGAGGAAAWRRRAGAAAHDQAGRAAARPGPPRRHARWPGARGHADGVRPAQGADGVPRPRVHPRRADRKGLGYTYDGLDRGIDSHIKNLRKKIEPARSIRPTSRPSMVLGTGSAQGEQPPMHKLWIQLALAFSLITVDRCGGRRTRGQPPGQRRLSQLCRAEPGAGLADCGRAGRLLRRAWELG